MKKWFVVLCVVMVAGSAYAGSILGGGQRLNFASLSTNGNTASVSTGTYGLADSGICVANVITGTATRTFTLQSSQNSNGPWTNATSAQTLTVANTDTYAFDFAAYRYGLYWRIHGISGFGATNTVTFICDVVRSGKE